MQIVADDKCVLAGHASECVALLLGDAGMSSSQAAQRLAATRALGSLLAAAPEALYPAVLKRATPLLDGAAHDAVCWLCSAQDPAAIKAHHEAADSVYVFDRA